MADLILFGLLAQNTKSATQSGKVRDGATVQAWSGQIDGTNRPTVLYSKGRNLPLHNSMPTRVSIPIGAGLFLFLILMLQIEGYVRRHSCGFSKGLIVRIAMFRTTIERGAIKKV